MATKKKSTKKSGNTLKETAREIGSRIGEVHVKASRMVEGVKAAVKASTAALKGKPKKEEEFARTKNEVVESLYRRKKAGALRRLLNSAGTKLLLGCDGVFRSFRDAEFHHGLGSDLDRLTGLRIASHAGLAVCLHQAAEAGNDEDARLLGLFDRGLCKCVEERCRGLVGSRVSLPCGVRVVSLSCLLPLEFPP